MRVMNYSAIELNENIIISSPSPASSNKVEKLLLCLIAALGIVGSLYVFSTSSNNNPNNNYQNLAIAAASVSDVENIDERGKEKFKKFFKIEGDKKAGELLNFHFKKDRKTSRYVLDMGNGERVIITSNDFPYKYEEPGKYLLELKTIQRGLITTISTKEIKIK